MFQRPTPDIFAVFAGDKDKIAKPPDTKAPQDKELNDRRARPSYIKAVNTKEPEKEG